MTHHQFIAKYINEKMKGHNLPYGFSYFNLLAKVEAGAERSWRLLQKK